MIDDIRNLLGDIASGKIKDARIALSEAKNAGFLRDIEDLIVERNDLSSKVHVLQTSLADSLAENLVLAAKLQPAPPVSDGLDDDCRRILLHFFENDKGFAIDDMTSIFDFHQSVAKAHFEELCSKRLIFTPGRIVPYGSRARTPVYSITPNGRALAMKI